MSQAMSQATKTATGIKKLVIPKFLPASSSSERSSNGRSSLKTASPTRRGTLNKLTTLATKVQVFLRCKGGKLRESTSSTPAHVKLKLIDNGSITSSITDFDIAKEDMSTEFVQDVVLLPSTTKVFHFDRVFRPCETQKDIFEDVAKPLINDVFKGASCTVFAYGQTGTGKTYTMEGDLQRAGNNIISEDSYATVSMLELYKEELRDLLCITEPKQLIIYDGKEDDRAVVHNLREKPVRNVAEGLQALKAGVNRRMTAATNINDKSSRSHCIFTINVYIKKEGSQKTFQVGKLNMVDLAGSENSKLAGADANRAKEAASINKSLLTLGRVITSLVDKTSHIPYRESKLTRLLKDSLGGHTKTCIIATIAPYTQTNDEVKNTLEYANMAKSIVNYTPRTVEISEEYQTKTLLKKIVSLEEDLQVCYEKNGREYESSIQQSAITAYK
ncbi:P-loop containing nucleoside triphosphate hydrolase protein [Mycotypha africana]|uniref:P-loop containing nucleoside triphosphate hydrolase protein n=1 Tax=Mycotypha africana TaxID=64632 RepID=UPI002301BD12|nr:P-loop containing nucleoside triphosphate hydrolase protein [Mycotypha africana]KAI8991859.1 P-loop containing nucleoside triphosphate hydrolase protein [Mycotypha africana]